MLRLRLQSSGCCRSFVFELKVVKQLTNRYRVCVCVLGTELGATGRLTYPHVMIAVWGPG